MIFAWISRNRPRLRVLVKVDTALATIVKIALLLS